jgi:hypothetical protein
MIQWYGWHSLSDEFSQQTSFETNIYNRNLWCMHVTNVSHLLPLLYTYMDIKNNIWNMAYHTQVLYARWIIVRANNMWYNIVIFKTKWEHKRATCGRGYGEINSHKWIKCDHIKDINCLDGISITNELYDHAWMTLCSYHHIYHTHEMVMFININEGWKLLFMGWNWLYITSALWKKLFKLPAPSRMKNYDDECALKLHPKKIIQVLYICLTSL